jgi:multidrug efflux pump subunit AcrA (membrane-fusion protein)
MRRLLAAAFVLAVFPGCRARDGSAAAPPAESPTPDAPTAVRVAAVGRRTLSDVVAGPGHTTALSQQKVRAPFAGTLADLRVTDGDLVTRGQTVATIVSRESEAALAGAREMLREASSPERRADAERALALAQQNLVRKPVLANADGPVLSHAATGGERVAEDQEIITIADASTIVFLADVPQSDLAKIRPGQPAQVEIGGRPAPLSGTVHSTLPGANPADFTGVVRIDLPRATGQVAIGLFGNARVTVASRPAALVVPDAAVVRDDVSGVTRVAAVVNGRAHWLTVTPGLKQNGMTEISGPDVAEGTAVIESGMVGLPEGKSVSAQPK